MSRSKTHFPDLDGLRFLAFFGVFCFHAFFAPDLQDSWVYSVVDVFRKNGNLGIDFFFTLSSFLITYLALEERQSTQSFSVKNFLIRRSLRIWPLYFFIVFIGFVLIPMAAQLVGVSISLPSLSYFLAFLANFYICSHGIDFLFLLTFLWSISVEEQFYVFWSLVLKFLQEYLVGVCFLLLGLSVVFRYFYASSSCIYFHPVTYLPNFTIGALLAYGAFFKVSFFQKMQRSIKKFHLFIFYLFALLVFIFKQDIFALSYLSHFENVFLALLFGFIIFEQTFLEQSLFKLRDSKRMTALGKWSYGLYCYHGVVLTVLITVLDRLALPESIWINVFLLPLVALGLTIGMAAVSYRYLERPFLRLKGRFKSMVHSP